MRRVAVIGWLILVSMAAATPRWGDDFDWVGDTLATTIPLGMVGIGDTLIGVSDNSMFALLQTGDTTFQKLWQITLPQRTEASYPNYYFLAHKSTHVVRDGNRFYYGWPRGMVEWDGLHPPVYWGAIRQGNQFIPDTNFTPSRHVELGTSYSYQYSSYQPQFSTGRLFVRYTVFAQDSSATFHQVGRPLADDLYSENAIRWPYAYCQYSSSITLTIVKLDSSVPRIVGHVWNFPAVSRSHVKIIRDTLITLGGDTWSVWSLENPEVPRHISSVQLARPVDDMCIEPIDSVYFAWCRGYISLLSLQQGLLQPQITDCLRVFLTSNTLTSNSVTRLNRGWLVKIGYDSDGSSQLLQVKTYRDGLNRHRIDTLWSYRPPSVFDSASIYYRPTYGILGKDGRAFVSRGNRRGVLFIDTVTARHEIRWLPETRVLSNRWYMSGNQVLCDDYSAHQYSLFTWSDGSWSTIVIPYPDTTYQYLQISAFRENQIAYYDFNRTSDSLPIYQIENGILRSDGAIQPSGSLWQLIGLRGWNAIVYRDSIAKRWSKIGGVWREQPETYRLGSRKIENLQSDTLLCLDDHIYVLPRQGAAYPIKAIPDFLPGTRYRIAVHNGNTFVVNISTDGDLYSDIYKVFDVLGPDIIERGTLFFGGTNRIYTAPVLFCGSMLLANTSNALSSYRVTPNTSVSEQNSALPLSFSLSSPYPNPFNSTVQFRFELPKAGITQYLVYDALGREVWREELGTVPAGRYYARWDGHNQSGTAVSSGMYFLRFTSGDFHSIKKIVMVK